jgi:hypothetical protein
MRQGDPISPILFNTIADMLDVLIARAKKDGQVNGLIPRLVDGGISIFNMLMIPSFLRSMILRKRLI